MATAPTAKLSGALIFSSGAAPAVVVPSSRLPLIDGLRAIAATMITWHHFASYPPLASWAMPVAGDVIHWLRDYSRATQVFFVIGGYVMARGMSRQTWDFARAGRFVVHRYCRLGIPYLAAIALAMWACTLARGTVDERVIGPPPSWNQILAHFAFAQYIVGYDSLSAGLWFVCINFQLGLIYVAGLVLRDRLAAWSAGRAASRNTSPRETASHELAQWLPIGLGWLLAAVSLFYFNLDQSWDTWAVYFFGHFFAGILVHRALSKPRGHIPLALYGLMLIAAMVFCWRGRLLTTLITASVLFLSGKTGFASRWFSHGPIAFLGRTSYSLFLVHFPVLIVVAMVWTRAEWTSPLAAVTALFVAYGVSLAVAAVFYRAVEMPAARLGGEFKPAAPRRARGASLSEPGPRTTAT